jgi:uncharacterized paraquat-inducible protein A
MDSTHVITERCLDCEHDLETHFMRIHDKAICERCGIITALAVRAWLTTRRLAGTG